MLFQSRTAQVTVFQGEDEVTGVRAGHGGYDYTLTVKLGVVTVRFVNTTTHMVNASLLAEEAPVPVPGGGQHDFDVEIKSENALTLEWGTRSALLRFQIRAE